VEAIAEDVQEDEPEAAAEPEAAEPEAAEAEEMPAAPEDPSDLDAFFASVDRLDHRTSAHLRWLHDALLRLVDEAEYTTDGDRQFLTGWMHGAERLPLFLLDSRGLLQLVIASLPEHEQREYADEVAGMLPDTSGSTLLAAGYADVDVPAHLDDQTLLEYLVDNLVEALPGGREAFGTIAPTAEEAEAEAEADDSVEPARDVEPEAAVADDQSDDSTGGEDYFDGLSGSHDEAELESALAGLGSTTPSASAPNATAAQDEPAASGEPEPTPDAGWSEREAPKQGGSRWLRRRGAA
jgi:hypothetical protein